MRLEFTLNGSPRAADVEPQRPLLDVLREDFRLTGAKYGCGEARCGACSVLIDGARAFSCVTPAAAAAGKSVRTIEGLAPEEDGPLHPVQQAFLDENAFQCGYCTSGMIMTAVSLLDEIPDPSEEEITARMDRNLCRCCAYPRIVKAVRRAARARKES